MLESGSGNIQLRWRRAFKSPLSLSVRTAQKIHVSITVNDASSIPWKSATGRALETVLLSLKSGNICPCNNKMCPLKIKYKLVQNIFLMSFQGHIIYKGAFSRSMKKERLPPLYQPPLVLNRELGSLLAILAQKKEYLNEVSRKSF